MPKLPKEGGNPMKVKKDPKYPFLVAGGMQVIATKDYMPSCEDVLKERKK